MSTLQKSTLEVLHHLSGREVHMKTLTYFYEHKDDETPVRHRDIHKLINGKSSAFSSHYLRSIVKFGLVEPVSSTEIYLNLGYKITVTGIKFFEMYKKIEKEIK